MAKSTNKNSKKKLHAKSILNGPKKGSLRFIARYSAFSFLGLTLMLNIFGIASSQPKKLKDSEVLAYSTSTTIDALLNYTNVERTSRGLSALTLNQKLNNSAQAKSNDMVATNYWAHNRPDGSLPWAFFYAAGYTGSNLGENLAYGHSDSYAIMYTPGGSGWMSSPEHTKNILNPNFCEVGFGITNSPNFISSGQQTIVSAHYGHPFGTCPGEVVVPPPAPAPTPAPTPPPVSPTPPAPTPVTSAAPKPTSKPATSPAITPKIVIQSPVVPEPVAPTPPTVEPAPELAVVPVAETTKLPDPAPKVVTSAPEVAKEGRRATRIELYTKGQAPWMNYAVSIGMITSLGAYALKHAIGLRKTVMVGEAWVLHHPTLDALILASISLTYFLSRSIGGFIK
jgi:hypothetical protein